MKSNYAKYGERSKVGTSRAVRNGFQREGQRVRLFRVVPEGLKWSSLRVLHPEVSVYMTKDKGCSFVDGR